MQMKGQITVKNETMKMKRVMMKWNKGMEVKIKAQIEVMYCLLLRHYKRIE